MAKIDIIIPAYHAHSTLPRTLASIAMQENIKDIRTVVCNDAGGDDYSEIISRFEPMMQVEEIVLPVNGGCGVARQYGIDRTHSPYFLCMDADDTFTNSFSVGILIENIERDPKTVMVSAFFQEQLNGRLEFKLHDRDLIWMHGKIYKRSFIDKYGIRFNETRSNEDNGFNTKIRLLANQEEKIAFTQDVVYSWHFKGDSITRVNDFEYTYNQSFVGYTENMIDAIEFARSHNGAQNVIDTWAARVMAGLYWYYLKTMHRRPEFQVQGLEMCRKFYKRIFADLEIRLSRKSIDQVFAMVQKDEAPGCMDFVPDFGIHEFIEYIKQEEPKGAEEHADQQPAQSA